MLRTRCKQVNDIPVEGVCSRMLTGETAARGLYMVGNDVFAAVDF